MARLRPPAAGDLCLLPVGACEPQAPKSSQELTRLKWGVATKGLTHACVSSAQRVSLRVVEEELPEGAWRPLLRSVACLRATRVKSGHA